MAQQLATLEFDSVWAFAETWSENLRERRWTIANTGSLSTGMQLMLPIKLPGTDEVLSWQAQVVAVLPHGAGLSLAGGETARRVDAHAMLVGRLIEDMLASGRVLLAPHAEGSIYIPDDAVAPEVVMQAVGRTGGAEEPEVQAPPAQTSAQDATLAFESATISDSVDRPAPLTAPPAPVEDTAPPPAPIADPTPRPAAPPPPPSMSAAALPPPPPTDSTATGGAIAPPAPGSAIAPPAPVVAAPPISAIAPPPPVLTTTPGPGPGFDPFAAGAGSAGERMGVPRQGFASGILISEAIVDIGKEGGSGILTVKLADSAIRVAFANGRALCSNVEDLISLCAIRRGRFEWHPAEQSGSGLDPRIAVFLWEERALTAAGRGKLDVVMGPHAERYVLCPEPLPRDLLDNSADLRAVLELAETRALTLNEMRSGAHIDGDRVGMLCLAAARAGLIGLAYGPMDSLAEGHAAGRLDRRFGAIKAASWMPELPMPASAAEMDLAHRTVRWMYGEPGLWPEDSDIQELQQRTHRASEQAYAELLSVEGRAARLQRIDPGLLEICSAVESARIRRSAHPADQPWQSLAEAGTAPSDAASWM